MTAATVAAATVKATDSAAPLWVPTPEARAASGLTRYMAWLERERGLHFADYPALWRWSVDCLEDFWESVWQYFDLHTPTPYAAVLDARRMPGARWFEGSRLNLAEQVFRAAGPADNPAILFRSETVDLQTTTWSRLRHEVAAMAQSLRAMGVQPGDRVAAYLPNVPETVVAFLAAASVGAVWSVCSPDMGISSVADRFSQITPKVLLVIDGYRHGGKTIDRRDTVDRLVASLPSVEHVVTVPQLDPMYRRDGALNWADLVAHEAALRVEAVPFDHPLWIVYSSGTTGLPKPIVHSHGGIVLEMLKSHGIHGDLQAGERISWFSTTGWMLWNAQVGALLVGATIALYDGSPMWPDLGALWRFAADMRLKTFGTGASFHANCMKAGLSLRTYGDFNALRRLGSTGSPLSDDVGAWLCRELGQDVLLGSSSGGTDVASAFVGAVPLLPLHSGEMQGPLLGVAVCAYDDAGREVIDQVGELVITMPMPSMPLYFWGDADGRRYRESYFDTYPGVWRHGDWLRITPRGGAVIYGRSDTTINRHGVRMGTGEIYRVVEALPEILDSLVVDLEYLGRPSWMALFVVLRPTQALDEGLRERVRTTLRSALSPRHVPDDIYTVEQVPRTLSGKKMELPVKKILLGMAPGAVANPDAMSNPTSLAWFEALAGLRSRAAAS